MTLELKNLFQVDRTHFPYMFEQNVDIPLRTGNLLDGDLIRANVYRPHDSDEGVRYPVLVTYGPCKLTNSFLRSFTFICHQTAKISTIKSLCPFLLKEII